MCTINCNIERTSRIIIVKSNNNKDNNKAEVAAPSLLLQLAVQHRAPSLASLNSGSSTRSQDTMSSFAETAGKPIHCKAAIAYGPNEPLTTEIIVVAPPKVMIES